GTGDVPEPADLRVALDHAVADQPVAPDREGHQPCHAGHAARFGRAERLRAGLQHLPAAPTLAVEVDLTLDSQRRPHARFSSRLSANSRASVLMPAGRKAMATFPFDPS